MFNITKLSDLTVEFELSGEHVSFANAIRRTCLVDVPVVAVDINTVVFGQDQEGLNTASVHNEYIAHRIAEMPLSIDPAETDDYEFKICDKDDSSKPWRNDSDVIVNFSSFDIVVFKKGEKVRSESVFIHDILLLRLKPDQQLKTSFKAIYRSVRSLETGELCPLVPADDGCSRNMRFSPCMVKYRFKTKKEQSGEGVQSIQDQFEYLGHEGKTPQTFLLTITTFGSRILTAQKIVEQALQIVISKFDRIAIAIKEDNSAILKRYPDQLPDITSIEIDGEDHTIGNLLVDAIMNVQGDHPGNFVAYSKTHPLDDKLIVKVKTQNAGDVLDTLLKALERLRDQFVAAHKQWKSAVTRHK